MFHASARVLGDAGNDTIFASGGETVLAGTGNDRLVFGANAHGTITATGGAGHDTFQPQYADANDNGFADAKFGRVVITDFTKHVDTLRFHDTAVGHNLTKATFTAAGVSTVTDNGHNVTIVVHTSGAAVAGTIVLRGIGNHHLHSINALINAGYHVTFDA